MTSPTINYNFGTEQDFGFYILNAVCHDWIHDFNNYERMGKILNYIMALVPSSRQLGEAGQQLTQLSIDETTQESDFSLTIDNSQPTTQENDRDLGDQGIILTEQSTSVVPISQGETNENEPTVNELYQSQAEQFLESSPSISIIPEIVDNSIQGVGLKRPREEYSLKNSLINIVNKTINVFNSIKSATQTKQMTRGNVRKINILQRLNDFIGECQLLVISKLGSLGSGIKKMLSGTEIYRGGGAKGIDIILTDDISNAIYSIIQEINENTNLSENDKKNLKNIFELMNEVFINFNIPGISPLEKFNNSLITDIISMFIVNKCETIDLKQEAILYLNVFIPTQQLQPPIKESQTIVAPVAISISPAGKKFSPTIITSYKGIESRPPSPTSITEFYGGSAFSQKIYADNKAKWPALEIKITEINDSDLYQIYIGNKKISEMNSSQVLEVFTIYQTFISGMDDTIKLIIGQQMFNVKTKQIQIIFKDLNSSVQRSNMRGITRYSQEMVDTINDLIFDKIINTYQDIKNKSQARSEPSSSEGRISGEAQQAVQQISKLVAKKTLELTGYLVGNELNETLFNGNQDLTAQARIIMQTVTSGKGYTLVDNSLIKYFNDTYGRQPQFMSGIKANDFLIGELNACSKSGCRVINNAIPNGPVKDSISNTVICPTSSVCDGMGAFGSCVTPSIGKQEFFNMDFYVSYQTDDNKFYTGSTILKSKNSAVNVNYGFQFNDLQIYNFLDININIQPIILQANYTFKGVIAQIITIWKSADSVTNIEQLWDMLENTEYFLSILKLGSQKAIGDIFQEINSTLENGGYIRNNNTTLAIMGKDSTKKTFGLMGDRPSGVRVIKLLKDAVNGKNPNSYGGYIGGETSLIYVPLPKIGGYNVKTYKRVKRVKKTRRHNKYKSIKKRKRYNKRTKKQRI